MTRTLQGPSRKESIQAGKNPGDPTVPEMLISLQFLASHQKINARGEGGGRKTVRYGKKKLPEKNCCKHMHAFAVSLFILHMHAPPPPLPLPLRSDAFGIDKICTISIYVYLDRLVEIWPANEVESWICTFFAGIDANAPKLVFWMFICISLSIRRDLFFFFCFPFWINEVHLQ